MSDKKLFLHDNLLKSYGCMNCVWKTYGQCPKGFTKPDESLPEGYCDEFAQFLFSLAEGDDSVSALKQKFMIYIQEIEAMSDYTEYRKLLTEYRKNREDGVMDKEMPELVMALQQSKLWWSRLTDSTIKGLGKVADREQRSKDVDKGAKQLNVQELNVILNNSSRVLLEEKNKNETS